MRGWNSRALVLSGVAMCVLATPAQAQAKNFDIPAQEVASAVGMLGRQANIQIVAARAFSRGKRTNAVRGTMTVEAALRQLLAGTGLVAQRSGSQTYVCGSAWKRDPGSGVIGVEKGPLISVI